jgi:hypothetical protein
MLLEPGQCPDIFPTRTFTTTTEVYGFKSEQVVAEYQIGHPFPVSLAHRVMAEYFYDREGNLISKADWVAAATAARVDHEIMELDRKPQLQTQPCAARCGVAICNLPRGHVGDHQQVFDNGGVIGFENRDRSSLRDRLRRAREDRS